MKATVAVADGHLAVFRPNVLMRSGGSTAKAKLPSHLPESEATLIGQSFLRSINGSAFTSGTTMFNGVRVLFSFLEKSQRAMPKTATETEFFLADSQKYILTGAMPGDPSLEARQMRWVYYTSLIRQLMADKILPSTIIPRTKLPRGRAEDNTSQLGVLGESFIPVPTPLSASDIWPDIYLGMPSYVAPTDDFLEHIHERLQYLSHETVTAAEDYWNSRMRKYRSLREKIDSVPPQRAAELLRSFEGKTIYRFTPEIDPKTEEGLLNILAIIKYMLINHDDVQNLTWKALADSTPRFAFNLYHQVQVTKEIIRLVGREPFHNEKASRAIAEALGLPTITDYSAAMIVLINDNPNFNPMSLGKAKLTNKNGKSYLTGTDDTQAMFSVEKRRSKARKKSWLSARSKRVFDEILEHTTLLREKLRKAQHPAMHSLFIEITSKGINESIDAHHQFSNKRYSIWTALKERLTAVGVRRDNFSLSSVRNTQGILEWFRTGSVRMMAKKMGNSTQTVLKSYMPPWILRRQYERIARAFQQKLIVLANLSCPWVLAASDFNTMEDLKAFMASALLRPNGRDQFTNAMEKAFRSEFPDEFEPFEHLKSKFLCLNLAPESLAALRLFLDLSDTQSMSYPEGAKKEEEILEIPVSDLKLLARMVQATVELPATSAAAQAIRSNLQGNSFSELTTAWCQSSEILSKWRHDTVHPKLSL